ncbi:hypothetical protein [Psychroserpens algicola]|uniref:Methyltransferase domain-containing protein n=1 Tax=Psychroserpens algicola TaxID=1719034 RepID=A0ABT0HBG8_9FLAO|nr:hypothetical protein [Psychroserpens algicola]MCK8481716.1 hypothetical protein [Psychroserpens algicola]
MDVIFELNNSSESPEHLEKFIENNFNTLYDYFSLLNHKELVENKKAFKSLLLKLNTFEHLNFKKDNNISFIQILLDASVRLGDSMFFESLYNLMLNNDLKISLITEASSLYLINVNTSEDLINIYDSFITKLELAFLNEEDNEDSVIASLFNYYGLFINEFLQFAEDKVLILREKIWTNFNDKNCLFLKNDIVTKLYQLNLDYTINPQLILQKILDEFLGRDRTIADFDISGFIIEKGTNYVNKLSKIECNFTNLLSINKNIYSKIKSDSIFNSLGRGVKILENESQLFAYMYALGNMHNKKLLSAFETLPSHFYENDINVIDWACGQGIASLSFFDYLKAQNHEQTINNVCLIEPSKIALKRASLHVNKCHKNIITVNKVLDSIINDDFKKLNSSVHLHIFSNILDMDVFSINQLLKLLSDNFKGLNYFVIASPNIEIKKTSRINSFVNHFSGNNEFCEYARIEEEKGKWQGTKWSRVIRVFKAEI